MQSDTAEGTTECMASIGRRKTQRERLEWTLKLALENRG